MAKLLKWLMVTVIPLLSIVLASCTHSEDEPNQGSAKDVYTFNKTKEFSKKWMVSTISFNGGITNYTFEYDAENRPSKVITYYRALEYIYECEYLYDGETCTVDDFKGYFDGNKLLKAERDRYTITHVSYDGDHLVRGSNQYVLTWDSNGNITNYSDGPLKFTYSEILNKANIDFNMFVEGSLRDCWCDDGSEVFTRFGWTGARTKNLISTSNCPTPYGYRNDVSYTVDNLGRPIEIGVFVYEHSGELRRSYKYTITYMES